MPCTLRERAVPVLYVPGWFRYLKEHARRLLTFAAPNGHYLRAEFFDFLRARKRHRKSPLSSPPSSLLLLRDQGFPAVYWWPRTGKFARLADLSKMANLNEFQRIRRFAPRLLNENRPNFSKISNPYELSPPCTIGHADFNGLNSRYQFIYLYTNSGGK